MQDDPEPLTNLLRESTPIILFVAFRKLPICSVSDAPVSVTSSPTVNVRLLTDGAGIVHASVGPDGSGLPVGHATAHEGRPLINTVKTRPPEFRPDE
jgi:hypothetical protein